jgi:sensor histidine kinase YesM
LFKDTVIQEQGNLNTSKKYETFKRTIEQFPDFSIEIRANNIIEPTLRNSFIGIVILVTLLIGLLLFILEKIVLTRATNPLVELCNNMELYSLKESVQTVDKNELDEVGSLYNSFNNMVERLQNTVDELVAARTGQVEAQMLALQAQVNPHFIHNTLAIISSLAEEGKTDKVETITNKLSSLIRYSSDFSHKEKLLREELDYIQDYLDLLEERFEDDFHYQIRGRDSIDEREVPKFIIQPLIENALSHSLKFSDYPWNITVTAITTNDYWRITVADNGKGITDEKIQELTDRISQISQSSLKELMDSIKIGGFSLLNSMVRIYLMFPGNQYFAVKRNNEGGTTITIGAHTNGK